jgi:DNA polymerase III delta subunit
MSLEDVLRGLLGTAGALIVGLVTALLSSFRRLARLEEQTADRQAQFSELRSLIHENRVLIDELRPLQTQVGFLWRMSETQALGALHHLTQPNMDAMIDGYVDGSLSIDQLRQFIQRLEVIGSGQSGAPEQVPAAQMTLFGAKRQLDIRLAHPKVLDEAKQALLDESDKRMAKATADESVRAESKGEPSEAEVSTDKAGTPPPEK